MAGRYPCEWSAKVATNTGLVGHMLCRCRGSTGTRLRSLNGMVENHAVQPHVSRESEFARVFARQASRTGCDMTLQGEPRVQAECKQPSSSRVSPSPSKASNRQTLPNPVRHPRPVQWTRNVWIRGPSCRVELGGYMWDPCNAVLRAPNVPMPVAPMQQTVKDVRIRHQREGASVCSCNHSRLDRRVT